MEFLQITSPDDYRVQEIFDSIAVLFRRMKEETGENWLLFFKPKVKIISVSHEARNVGYLIIWELSNYTLWSI